MKDFHAIHLPPSWALSPLSDVAAINPKLDKADFINSMEVSFIPMPAVEARTGVVNVTEKRPFGEVKKGYTAFREGDVLFAKITPCMENGKMAVVPKSVTASLSARRSFMSCVPALELTHVTFTILSHRSASDTTQNTI